MKITDDLYFIITTSELIIFANLMGVEYFDLKQGSSFKRKLYKRVKDHTANFIKVNGRKNKRRLMGYDKGSKSILKTKKFNGLKASYIAIDDVESD